MTLIKTSVLSFFATSVKMLSALVINKALAVYVGPSGLAMIGQFQSFSQFAVAIAQAGLNTGVTKYTAEYGKDDVRIPLLFSTASKICLFSSMLIGSLIIILSEHSSQYVFKSSSYQYIFVIFGLTIVLFVINNLLLSILNGLKEIKIWFMISVVQSSYGLVITTLLIVFLGVEGGLIALVTNQSVVLLVLILKIKNHPQIRFENFKSPFSVSEAKKLAGYSAMALTSAATVPLSHFLIRDYIGETLGFVDVGYWQGMWYISSMYLMMITTVLSIYYLPKLSEITGVKEVRDELCRGYVIILPVVIAMSTAVFFIKDHIILLLFSAEFNPMRELFFWQLVGDVAKVASFLFGYILVARAMVKVYVVTEIIFSISFFALSVYFVQRFGLVGMSYSFALNYFLHLMVMAFVTRKEWRVIGNGG